MSNCAYCPKIVPTLQMHCPETVEAGAPACSVSEFLENKQTKEYAYGEID
jgi:hypothetical protein